MISESALTLVYMILMKMLNEFVAAMMQIIVLRLVVVLVMTCGLILLLFVLICILISVTADRFRVNGLAIVMTLIILALTNCRICR